MNFPQAAAMSTLRFVTTWGYNPRLAGAGSFFTASISGTFPSRARAEPTGGRGSGRLSDARAVLKEARGRGYHLRRVFAMV